MDSESSGRGKLWLAILLVVAAGAAVDFSLLKVGLFASPTAAPGADGGATSGDKDTAASATPVPCAVPAVVSTQGLQKVDLALIHELMGPNRAYGETVEKAALETYDKLNPKTSPWYDAGRVATQLFAIYATTGDFYGLGISQAAAMYGQRAWEQGCREPMIMGACNVFIRTRGCGITKDFSDDKHRYLQEMLASPYPAICKLEVASRTALHGDTLIKARTDMWKEDLSGIAGKVPEVLQTTLQQYGDTVAAGAPESVLWNKMETILEEIGYDEKLLLLLGAELDRIYAKNPPPGALRELCASDILISRAWAARGTGFADTVTEQGWKTMKERLAEADDLLARAEVEHSDDPRIPTLRITVELGQGFGRDRMEQFFERAVKTDPNYYEAYRGKMYYLQPRWYGTPKDVFDFGSQCAASGRWNAKVPMIFIYGVDTMGELIKEIHGNEEIWKAMKAIYEGYLKHYPGSTIYRTEYAMYAADEGKWDVVKTQLDTLGPDWDQLAMSLPRYQQIKARADAGGK